MFSGIILTVITTMALETRLLSQLQRNRLEMWAEKSFGSGMALKVMCIGVPALYHGVQIKEAILRAEPCLSFLLSAMVLTGLGEKVSGRRGAISLPPAI